jgi:AcrR family transcriptional regulator
VRVDVTERVRSVARQARSEATRRKIINAAVELFCETGYVATGLGDIIERAEITKGALYYHFDSKESLATAIIEESGASLLKSFRSITESSSPAFENMIHGVFVVADVIEADKLARTGLQLLRAFAEFNEAAVRTYEIWLGVMSEQARQAQVEGDVRPNLDPVTVGESVLGVLLGTELIGQALSGGADLIPRVARVWQILLTALATAESLPYFREFLARETLRHQPEPSIE